MTAPWPIVGGVSGGVDSAVGVGGAGVADDEVLVLGAARVRSAVPGVPLEAGGWSACGPGGVVPVVSSVGVFLSGVLGSVVVFGAVGGWWCRCVAAVGGAGDGVGEAPPAELWVMSKARAL